MSTKIKKRDRDLDWISAYRDLENPRRIKEQKSSNMVFIGTVSVVGIALIIYVQLMNQNLQLTKQIRECEDYISSEINKDLYEWNNLLKTRSASLINYRDGAEKFLDQLKNTKRISEDDYRYYEQALKDSTSTQSYITGFNADYNMVKIQGVVPEESMPRLFAEYLANQTDETGERKFADVQYTGFSRNNNMNYEFSVTVTLWEQVK